MKDSQISVRNRNGKITQSFLSLESHDRDKISESSSRIKTSIKKTLYSAFPDHKDKKTMNKLGEMQARAQLDALKRFIQ